MNRKVKPHIVALFLAPGLLMYAYFFVYPLIRAFYLSLTEWNGFSSEIKFVGLGNFSRMLSDPQMKDAIVNTLFYLVLGAAITFGLGFLFTYLLTRKGFKGRKPLSNYFYFPNMISQAALAVLWVFVFSSNFGLLDALLTKLGLASWIRPWFGTRWMTMIWLTICSCICSTGYYLILLLSGYDRVPQDCIEAASIDGATDLQIYFKISLPLMRSVIVVAMSMWIINAIKFFDLPWAMFRGQRSTVHTLGTYMYVMAFGQQIPIFELGYSCAVAVVMFLLVVLIGGGFRKIFDRDDLQF